MTTGLPDVRQLVFDDLVKQARGKLPQLCSEWTYHGTSDPGITLLELVASFSEMLTYRASRQTDAITKSFLELLSGEESSRSGEELLDTLHRTLAELWTRYRAVSCEDYCHLAHHQWPETTDAKSLGAAGEIARVHCLPERNLSSSKPLAPAPGRVSLIVLPRAGRVPTDALRNRLWKFFEPRRLLTTRLHVVRPKYIKLKVKAHIYLKDGVSRSGVIVKVKDVLTSWFDPHMGGDQRTGWPFGGNVYLSSVYRNLDDISGIDFVKNVQVTTTAKQRTLLDVDNHIVGLRIDPHELAEVDPNDIAVTLHEFAAGEWREVSA